MSSMDKALATDHVSVARIPGVAVPADHASWQGIWTLEKFAAPVEWYAERYARSHASARQVALLAAGQYDRSARYVKTAAIRAMRKDLPAYSVSQFQNGALNTGINSLWNIFFGNSSAANTGASPAGPNAIFNNAQARIAVGDSATAFAASQTWLQAATNKFAQVMDATFPSVSAQTISFRITVAGGNANFSWQEFVVDNGGGSNSTSTTLSGGAAINRAVSNQGTKTAGQTWVPTVTITLS